MSRPLGSVQKDVLRALREHGAWRESYPHYGWIWNTVSNTKRILDSLVKRGDVTRSQEGVYRPKQQQQERP